MKQCFKCGKTKPLEAYYEHPRMADGHLNKCKECTKADCNANFHMHADRENARRQKRYYDNWDLERKNAHLRLQTLTTEQRITMRERNRQWALRNKHKRRAQNRLRRAVKSGKIIKPVACQQCGCTKKLQAHHHDYDKSLDVKWLCTACHGFVHRKTEYAKTA